MVHRDRPRELGHGWIRYERADAGGEHRPPVLPAHGHEECLTAQDVDAVDRPGGEKYSPPLPVRVLQEVRVADVDDRIVAPQMSVREDGVAGAADEGAGGRVRPGDRQRMVHARAALGRQQVDVTVAAVEVGALGPHRAAHCAAPHHVLVAAELECRGVQLAHPDLGLLVPFGLSREPRAVGPDTPVVVEEQRRVDPAPVPPHRVGPGSGGVVGGDDEVPLAGRVADEGAHDEEAAPVVPDRGREESVGVPDAAEVELAWPVDRMADELPGDQVPRAVDRQPRQVLEAGVDGVEPGAVVAVDAARRRVRIEAWQDGIRGSACGRRVIIQHVW